MSRRLTKVSYNAKEKKVHVAWEEKRPGGIDERALTCPDRPAPAFLLALTALRKHAKADDGLALPWSGLVWLNPPYGEDTPRWLDRLADHGNGLALVFARTDTAWFHRIVARASALCFLRGRIAFLRGATVAAGAGAGAGSLLIAFGETAAEAVMHCKLGWCIRPARAAA